MSQLQVWQETPMLRFARCPVHGCLVTMRWTRLGWQWTWGCTGCLAEVDKAVERVEGLPDG